MFIRKSFFEYRKCIALIIIVFHLFLVQNANANSVFRIQISSEPVSLDPSRAEDGLSLKVFGFLMSGLMRYDANNKLVLGVASKVEKLSGGKKYRFTIPTQKWSDGKPLTASDFVWGFQRIFTPATPSKLADLYFKIKNSRNYKTGSESNFANVGVKAVSDSQLEIELEEPSEYFLQLLTLPPAFPQRPDFAPLGSAITSRDFPVTGPYKISQWVHDQKIELERNPNFFGTAAPIEKIIFQVIPEDPVAVNLLRQGSIDLMFRAPLLDVPKLRELNLIREFPLFATYYLGFNQKKKPWDDVRARRAVARTLDREALLKQLGLPSTAFGGWVPNGVPGYSQKINISRDVLSAKKEWAANFKNQEIVLGFDMSGLNKLIIERIQNELQMNLSAKVTLNSRDWKSYISLLNTDAPGIFRFGWLNPFIDPVAAFIPFHSASANNYTGWKNAEYDRLLNLLGKNSQNSKRQKIIDQLTDILLVRDVVVIPLFHYTQTAAVSPRVKSIAINGLGVLDPTSIQILNE